MANLATATYAGRSIITSRLKNAGQEPKNIGWGASGAVTGSANSDVNLFAPAPEARVAGASVQVTTTQLADTYQVTGSITCAGASKTITEAGLFDTVTNTPSTSLAVSLASTTITTLSLAAALASMPTAGYYAQLSNEVVLVTSGGNTAVLGVVRAQLGSIAVAYPSGTVFTPGGDGGAYAGATLGGATATWTAALGGSMFAHADFAGIAVNTADSINFTFKDQFN